MTNAAITTAAHAAAKYFRICDRHPVKTVLPPCAQDPVENRQPLSVPGRQCRCSGMARRLESKLRKCRWLIWSGKAAGNAISDDHARNRSAVFGRIGPDGRHNDTGAAQFLELITFEICFGDRALRRHLPGALNPHHKKEGLPSQAAHPLSNRSPTEACT